MPINQKMMRNMKSEYGDEKGERVYYAMENKMKMKGSKKAGNMKAAKTAGKKSGFKAAMAKFKSSVMSKTGKY